MNSAGRDRIFSGKEGGPGVFILQAEKRTRCAPQKSTVRSLSEGTKEEQEGDMRMPPVTLSTHDGVSVMALACTEREPKKRTVAKRSVLMQDEAVAQEQKRA